MTRLLLADDHPMIRTAIEVLLRDTSYDIVGVTASGAETLSAVEQLKPDVLLLDLQMPDGTGMDVFRELKSKGSAPRVIILTAAIDDASLMEAKSTGVSGMVLKSSDPAFIIECLDRVSRGSQWIDPELAERVRELADTFGSSGRPAPCRSTRTTSSSRWSGRRLIASRRRHRCGWRAPRRVRFWSA